MPNKIKNVLSQIVLTLPVTAYILTAFALALCVACGGGGGSTPAPVSNPVPSITSLSPSSATAGATAQTLTVNGTNFLSSSTVTYNGVSHTATFVSSTQVTIPLTAADQGTAGAFAVVVTNPSPGGGASNPINFTVNNNVPAVTSISPSSLNASISAVSITVTGTNFVLGATANLNGSPLTTSFVSSTQLTATVSAASQVAGNYVVTVTNPAPGGGISATSAGFTILPVVVGISPSSGPVGSTLFVTILGANTAEIGKNVVTFTQASQPFSGTAIAASGSSSGIVLSVTVPSGLSPSIASAVLSAPSVVSVSVSGVAAGNSTPFEVTPTPHALAVSPPSAEQNTSVIIGLVGVSTSFDSITQLTTDDSGLTTSNVFVASPQLITAKLTIGSGVAAGSHTITATTGSNSIPFNFMVLTTSSASLTLSSLSTTSLPPIAPISLLGSGFTAGGLVGSSVVVSYTYSTSTIEVPVVNITDTEIDTLAPAFVDPSTGQFYTGSASVQVLVNGRASTSLPITILPLPANTGSVGTTTKAYLSQIGSQLTAEQTQLAGFTNIPASEITAVNSWLSGLQKQLISLTTQISTAASGGTGTAPDGTTFGKNEIDIVDRFLQTAQIATSSAVGSHQLVETLSAPETTSGITEGYESIAGKVCKAADVFQSGSDALNDASLIICIASALPPLAPLLGPVCGLLKSLQVGMLLIQNLDVICGLLPANLDAVLATPYPLIFPVTSTSGGSESLLGTFKTVPSAVPAGVSAVLDDILQLTDADKVVPKWILGPISGSVKVAATWGFDAIQWAGDNIIDSISPGSIEGLSETIPLTSATVSFMPDPAQLVNTSGLTVLPVGSDGSTTLNFNLSDFRLLNSTQTVTTNSTQVTGDSLPVTVKSVVTVTPVLALVAEGGGMTFSANVAGTTNQTVSWSVNGTAGGNSSVGIISTGGAYVAPSIPGTYTVTATSALDGSTGTAQVTVNAAAVTVAVSPVTAQVVVNGLQQFTATVSNTSNTAVTWSVNGVAGGSSTAGTISAGGLYTAPATVPTQAMVTVTATSQAITTASGSASVTIGPYNETPVYSFTSLSDGAAPRPLILGSDGYFYGTAQLGGTDYDGTVFKVDSSGKVTSLHEFTGADGEYPIGALVQASDGYFYGMTQWGGANNDGVIFKMDSTGSMAAQYSFTGGSDGAQPSGALVIGTDGYFYGVAYSGGNNSVGTVFKADSSLDVTPLYQFTGGSDGAGPVALTLGSDGNLYGVAQNGGSSSCTAFGGSGCGTVFQVTTAGALTPLYAFTGGTDGSAPEEALLQGSDGLFYGTTVYGGDASCTVSSGTGCGTIFTIDTIGRFNLVHEFSGGSEGGVPFSSLIQATDGDFYGTATAGGDPSCSVTASGETYSTYIGCGTVFKMDSAGNVSALYSFTGTPNDGSNPFAAVVEGDDGYLYGTTRWGGTDTTCSYTNDGGCGTVFKVSGPGGPLPLPLLKTAAGKQLMHLMLNPVRLTPHTVTVAKDHAVQKPSSAQNAQGVKRSVASE